MPRLFLRVLSEAQPLPEGEGFDIGVEWLIKESDGSVRGSGVTDYRGLADVADPNVDWLGDPDNTVVILPSQFVLMVNCEVPGRSAAQIRRALPFAAEEFVASDIESMHIAHGTIRPGSPVLCNIVAHELMTNWLACFNSLQVTPGHFVVDAEVLPRGAGQVSALFEGDTVLIASSDQAATVDRGNLLFALNTLSAEQIVAVNGEISDLEQGQLEGNPEIETIATSEHGVIDYLAEQFDGVSCINLLQGEYRPVRRVNPNATRWRSIGALAAVWIVIGFLGLVVQGWWAGSEADRLQAESFALYKELFPRESQPVGIDQLRRRMGAKIGQKTTDGGASAFVGLTAHFANAADANSRVQSMNYQGQREELTVEVMLASFQASEELQKKLGSAGIDAESTSLERDGDQVRSRMRLRFAQ